MAPRKQTTTAADTTTLGYVLDVGASVEPQTIPGVPGLWTVGVPEDPRRFGVDAIEFGELLAAAGAADMFQACEVEPWQQAMPAVLSETVADDETTETED